MVSDDILSGMYHLSFSCVLLGHSTIYIQSWLILRSYICTLFISTYQCILHEGTAPTYVLFATKHGGNTIGFTAWVIPAQVILITYLPFNSQRRSLIFSHCCLTFNSIIIKVMNIGVVILSLLSHEFYCSSYQCTNITRYIPWGTPHGF